MGFMVGLTSTAAYSFANDRLQSARIHWDKDEGLAADIAYSEWMRARYQRRVNHWKENEAERKRREDEGRRAQEKQDHERKCRDEASAADARRDQAEPEVRTSADTGKQEESDRPSERMQARCKRWVKRWRDKPKSIKDEFRSHEKEDHELKCVEVAAADASKDQQEGRKSADARKQEEKDESTSADAKKDGKDLKGGPTLANECVLSICCCEGVFSI